MFQLPNVQGWTQNKEIQVEFKGLNHNFTVGDGEFYDMQNMTSEFYPVTSPRKKRSTISISIEGKEIKSIITKGTDVYYIYVSGGRAYFCKAADFALEGIQSHDLGEYQEGTEFIHAEISNRIFVAPKGVSEMSAFVYNAYKDKMFPIDFREYISWSESEESLFKECGEKGGDGKGYARLDKNGLDSYLEVNDIVEVSFPSGGKQDSGLIPTANMRVVRVTIGFVVLDYGLSDPNEIFDSRDLAISRRSVPLDYVCQKNNRLYGCAKYDREADKFLYSGRSLSIGEPIDMNYTYGVPVNANADDLNVFGRAFYVKRNEEEHKDWTGVITEVALNAESDVALVIYKNSMSAELIGVGGLLSGDELIPLDEIEHVNSIFVSAWGSPASWLGYDGTAAESYYTDVDHEGDWTGIKSFGDYVLFFKEDRIYQFYGTEPSNYGYYTIDYTGIKKGSSSSAHIVENTLYYHSKDGMAAFSSGAFGVFSSPLGKEPLEHVKCSSDGKRLYVAAKHMGKDVLYVFDTELGLWHKEDNTRVDAFVKVGSSLGYTTDGMKKLVSVDEKNPVYIGISEIPTKEQAFEWMMETGKIGVYTPDHKRLIKINLRAQIPVGGRIDIYIKRDEGDWSPLQSLSGSDVRLQTFPVYPVRCDHFSLRFSGTGDTKIISLTKTIEGGSDR